MTIRPTSGWRPDVSPACRNLQADTDPVLPHLAAALLPSLSKATLASTLFVDQMVLAMQAHLISRFSPVPVRRITTSSS